MKLGRWVLFAFTTPWSLTVGFGWVLLAKTLGLAEDLRWEYFAVLSAQWKPWVTKHWRYSTTLGRGIIYQAHLRSIPGAAPSYIQNHEHVHIRQVEDLMVLSFVVGLVVGLVTGHWALGALLWWSGGLWQLPNFVTAVLRGGAPYMDSEHERAAYSETSIVRDENLGKSWLEAGAYPGHTWKQLP